MVTPSFSTAGACSSCTTASTSMLLRPQLASSVEWRWPRLSTMQLQNRCCAARTDLAVMKNSWHGATQGLCHAAALGAGHSKVFLVPTTCAVRLCLNNALHAAKCRLLTAIGVFNFDSCS